MIFVTVGSQKFQFNRLVSAVDMLKGSGVITDEVFIQSGESDYIPRYCRYKHFLNRDDFARISGQSNLFITHGGTGAIVGALKTGKKVIAVPRLSKYGELVDDHQVQILQQFDEMKLILPCYEIDQLADKIKTIQNMQFNTYKSNTDTIIRILSNLIDGNLSSSL